MSKKKKGSKKPKEEKPIAEEPEVQEENAAIEAAVAVETEAMEAKAATAESIAEEESAKEEQAPAEAVSLDDLLDEPAGEAEEQTVTEETLEGGPADGEATTETEGEFPELLPSVPLKHIVEAILFASQKPVSIKELVTILKGAAEADKEIPESPALPFAKIKPDALRAAVEELRIDCQEPASTYEVRENAAGWQLVTKGDYSPWLRQLFPENRSARISAPAMETLAIIAYRQPITRADLEAVRGVAVDGVMQTLLDRSLIKIAGRAEIPGRPLLYETTQHFMEHFGLTNLDDLPNATELRKISLPKAPVPEDPAPAPPAETPAAAEAAATEPALPEGTVDEADIEGSTASPEAYFGEQPPIEEAPPEKIDEAHPEPETAAEPQPAAEPEPGSAEEIPVENVEPSEEAPEKPDPHKNS